jgi:hypothetical protein
VGIPDFRGSFSAPFRSKTGKPPVAVVHRSQNILIHHIADVRVFDQGAFRIPEPLYRIQKGLDLIFRSNNTFKGSGVKLVQLLRRFRNADPGAGQGNASGCGFSESSVV